MSTTNCSFCSGLGSIIDCNEEPLTCEHCNGTGTFYDDDDVLWEPYKPNPYDGTYSEE